ncbi:MAG: alpha/beta hydrolase [Methylophilaceae bacterium]|nr:alpha/beta fold hydrolase [Methyloradius sp.]
MLESLVIETSAEINASVIWLHGLGADGHDFAPIVEELGIPNLRFILPHAPVRPVTMNNGHEMPAWYDIYGLNNDSLQDESGIRATEGKIAELIAHELSQGIPAKRIVLAGFSQGGAIALHTALRYPQRLAGVLALSTYLPLKTMLLADRQAANLDLPIFMAHGEFDSVITLATSQASKAVLTSVGYVIDWHEYAMAHSVCVEEIDDIRDFLNRILA